MPEESPTLTAQVKLAIAGKTLAIDLTVPNAPVRLDALLPVFQSLADAVIGRVVAGTTGPGTGRTISCKAGCGACCRQLVPIAEAEARRIRDLVEHLPEPRRGQVRERFAAARRRLEASGMLEALLHPERIEMEEHAPLGLAYFHQQLACPFLEEESCSIHTDRPIACREYLVTSPAVHCADPTPETIDLVKLPCTLWSTLLSPPTEALPARSSCVPLVLAPEWAENHPEEPPARTATDWVVEAIGRLTGTLPPPPSPRE